MKRLITATLAAACFFSAPHLFAAPAGSNSFKYHMHQIFDSYNNARISFSLKQFDITTIYLQKLQESIESAEKNAPQTNRDGTELDRKLFQERISQLKKSVASLKEINAVKFRDPILTDTLSKNIFSMCVTCHKEVKMDYLFNLPKRTTLFGEYMHKVSDNLDLALIKSEDASLAGEVKEHVQLLHYYIDLLLPIFPEAGPSGVIMDRPAFQERVKAIKSRLKVETGQFKSKELESSRETLNTLCVACHEPERIK